MKIYTLEYKGKHRGAFTTMELATKDKLKYMSVVKDPRQVKIVTVRVGRT